MENELKKMKLMLENGARFGEPSGKLPADPVIENQFLNYVDEFEKNYRNAETILIYDFIGRPEFRIEKEIPDSQISAELESIMNIINRNGIQIDTICDVEEREIYRFVTEELFFNKIDNMRIKGMITCFIYEEFHPNHEYDIRTLSHDGIKSYLNKETDYYTNHFSKEAKASAWYIDFRDAFGSFSLRHFEITRLSYDEQNASVSFNIDFTGNIEGSDVQQFFTGEGTLELISQYGFWSIQKINFPVPAGVA